MSNAKGSVIERHGAYFWRRREKGKDLPLKFIGRKDDISHREAVATRDRWLREMNPLQHSQGERITLKDLATEYDRYVIDVAMKDSSARSVRSRVNKHVVPLLGDLELMQIDVRQQQRLIKTLVDQQLARSTIYAVMSSLSCMFVYARNSGYLAPIIDYRLIRLPPAEVAKERRWFTTDESLRIIQGASFPWRAAFAVAAMLGLRCGEILALRWIDIDFTHKLIHVRQNAVNRVIQTVKSKNSRASLPMPEPLELILRKYAKEAIGEPHADVTEIYSEQLIFHKEGAPFTGDEFREQLREVLQAHRIKHGGIHAFRHGMVTFLLDQGVPIHTVQRIARHAKIETTAGYAHTQAESLRDGVNVGKEHFGRGNKRGTDMQKTTGDLQ